MSSLIKFKPFVKKILTEEQIEDLKEIEAPWVPSHSSRGSTEETYVDIVQNGTEYENAYYEDRAFRLSSNKVITTEMIQDIVDDIDLVWKEEGLRVVDTNYLRYVEGDWLGPHIDSSTYQDADGRHLERQITAVTMLDKADDLRGGTLCVYQKGLRHEFNLEIGETVFFPAGDQHECTKIRRGFREILVSWMA